MFNQENINQLMQEHLNSEDIKKYINEKIRGVVKENIDEQFKHLNIYEMIKYGKTYTKNWFA